MKRIAIDMDEVLADIMPKFLDLYEQYFGKRLQPEDYAGSKIYKLPGAYKVRNALFEKGFFRDLPAIEGSVEGVRTLMEHYEVFIVTAAMEFRSSFEDKYDWLQEHFPFIHWKNIIFCGDKSIIRTDYMIDDHAFNLETFQGKGLLFTAAHNLEETRFQRVNNWEEVLNFFEQEATSG
jgi:5'-nucleotidase